ncbi:MAG: DUF3419 family protein [candidate division WOR-3 bacterium]|nr:MAG: DUF3419 family protein [candidate division WOR-3 bacterium]
MKPFLETLNYTSSNEDGESEIRALNLGRDDTVLCITGSGARSLDLLTKRVAKIVSIDFNPCQNFLLELKMSAIGELDYDGLLEFLGICRSTVRLRDYKRLRESLSTEARGFWDANLHVIEQGVIYQGRWEKYFGKLAYFLKFVCPDRINRIFTCRDIDEQAELWQEMRADFKWRKFLQFSTSNFAWKYLFRDPGFYAFLEKGFSVYKYLDTHFTAFFNNCRAADSPFATLLFFGRYEPDRCLPLHLRRQHFETIKKQIPRVHIVTQALQEHIATYSESRGPNKYSLSDVASYTSPRDYEMIWKHLVRAAPYGSRICERQFLVKHQLPISEAKRIRRDRKLESELAKTDNSIFYTFVVAELGAR